MLKTVAVCCLLAVCHSACVAETGTCVSSDEAALLQKDVRVIEQPEINLKETNQHVSEAISLAVFLDKAEHRLELATELNAKAHPMTTSWDAAVLSYHNSKRSQDDLDQMINTISPSIDELAVYMQSKIENNRKMESGYKEKLVATLDNLEHEGELGDKIVSFGTKWGENKLLGDLAAPVFQHQKTVKKAMKKYKEEAKDGFNDKAFGQMFGAVQLASQTIGQQFDLWAKVGEVKLKEVKESASKFRTHDSQSLNDAIWQQVALEKAHDRAEMAHRLNDKFTPLGNMMMAETGAYKASKHTSQDFKKWNSAVLNSLGDIKSDLKATVANDAAEEADARAALVKTLDKLEDEGEFAKKLTKFASAWGRGKLGHDLLAAVEEHDERVSKDMAAYDEKTHGTFDDPAFGKTFGSVNNAAVGLMGTFGQWTITGYTKIGEISEGNSVLEPFEQA